MKIFYAVQATGNGHISRAMTLLPYLKQYGTVDIFLSGDNSHLQLDAPIKYRSRGISLFYNSKGGLNYWQMIKRISPSRLLKDIRELPVEKYDLIINDFDFITSAACARKKKASVHFGHQASFQSPATPRPANKAFHGEYLLKHYVKATYHCGLHFEKYDDSIFLPVIKDGIIRAEPVNEGHITVYLPSYSDIQLFNLFRQLPAYRFEVFSPKKTAPYSEENVTFKPVNKSLFNTSLIRCEGIICGAGFETPAEALHLGKKIIAIPINGQYEQQCNAAALENMGITCLNNINNAFCKVFSTWIQSAPPERKNYSGSIGQSLEYIFSLPFKYGQPLMPVF
ncbi:MAG: glycosyl transferase [Chitinophagaceae bacterium]|nr:glycosyl transferase [Chitinophagaceae bacterium]